MKKAIVILLAVCILCSTVGCSALENLNTPAEPVRKLFLQESYDLQIMADETFYEKTGGSFDLQLTNDTAYISIMAYRYEELPEGTTARDVYDIQNQDIFSKREAVTEIEKTTTFSLPQGEVIYGVHTAKRDGNENYYITYLVDLPKAQTLAWVLVTALPSHYSNNKEHLHNIVCSLTAAE